MSARPAAGRGGMSSPALPSFGEALRVWTRVALQSFGGPAGQIAVMHRILVEEKRWISEQRFLHALSYCMLLPGPEAQQLATYVGWLLHRTPGGLVAGALFVLPGFIAILGLSLIYAAYARVAFVDGVFFGIKAAVLALVLEALLRIGRRALVHRIQIGIAVLAFVAIFFFAAPFPWIIAAAAALGLILARLLPEVLAEPRREADAQSALADALLDRQRPLHTLPSTSRALALTAVYLLLWWTPALLLASARGAHDVFTTIAFFFGKVASVTFGGAYAVLPYVAQQAVENYRWLTPGEMLDGLGMAETTPGPLIMVVQFVGFLGAYRSPGALEPWVAGTLAAVLTTWMTFVPSFLWIFVGAPYAESLRESRALRAALAAITAAVVGVVLNLALWFALHTLFGVVEARNLGPLVLQVPELRSLDLAAAAIAAGAIVATFRFHVSMLPLIGVCALLGVGWRVLWRP
jgi:chromate transporter